MFCSPEYIFHYKLFWKPTLNCISAVRFELLLKLWLNVFLSSLSLFSYANALFSRIALVYIFMHFILCDIKVRLTGLIVNQSFLQKKKSLKVVFMQNLIPLCLFEESVDKTQVWHRFGGLSDEWARDPGYPCAVCTSQLCSRLFREVIMHTAAGSLPSALLK